MSLRFELLPSDERRAWDEALRAIPHAYWHGWPACNAIGLGSGQPVHLCVASDEDGVLAAAPFAERQWQGERDLYTPTGFSGFAAARPLPSDFSQQWHAFAASRGYVAGYFALHPVCGAAGAHSGLVSDNELFVLDLVADGEEQLRRCDRSVRRAVKEAGDSGLRYVEDRAALTAFVLGNYAGCLRALGARPLWPEATLSAMSADPDLLMVGVEDEAGLCAMHSFGVAGRGAELHLHLSVREGRRHTTALIWWGLRRLASMGVEWAHFGGGVERGDSLARSKQKFRPSALPFLRACEVYRPDAYAGLCARAGVDPRSTRFHPAYQLTAQAAEPAR